MGTTSDKLTYLNTTKSLIKDNLNLGGANITNEPFRAYSSKLEGIYKDFLANGIDVLWNNWEKVSGSGTSVALSNTIKAPIKTNLKGNTSQNGTPTPSSPVEVKTTTGRQEIDVRGKNLLPYPYFTTSSPFTNNGITYTINNDGTINVNGTATGRSSMPLYGNYLVENQKDLTGRYIKGGTSNVNMYVFAHIGNQYPVLAQDTGQGAEIDKSNYQKGYIELVVTQGTTVNNELIKPMMLNSLDDTTYEEYKLQSYEINLGKNLLDVSSFPQNSYVSGGITTLIEGQMLSCSGTATSTSFNIGSSTVTFNLKLKNNTTYTISRTNAISERLYIRLYNSDKTQNQDVQIVANSKSTTFTTTFDVNSCYLFMVGHSSGSVLNIKSFGVQIEKGSQASQYSLYKTPIELCKIGTYQDRIYKDNGKWYLDKKIGKIASYNGETITTDYISTTGQLTTGATIYYVLATPTTTEITDYELINQLNELEKAKSYENQTNINQIADLPFELDAVALKGE